MKRAILAILTGIFAGVGIFTFQYAEGLSYFSTNPRACMNCHIMRPEFDSWQKGSHHTTATCVGCHLPHNFFRKYLAKGDNGYRHSKGFTFQNFHEPINITPRNSAILQENCLRCHNDLVHGLGPVTQEPAKAIRCVHCHDGVGHGDRVGMGRFDQKEFQGRKGS